MDPDNQDLFQPTPDRLSEFSRAVFLGDPAGAVIAARKATEAPLSEGVMTLIAIVGLLYALTSVLRQLRLWTQPVVNRVAERIGRPPKARANGAAPAAEGDPADVEELDRTS